jgi:hypothetical protein
MTRRLIFLTPTLSFSIVSHQGGRAHRPGGGGSEPRVPDPPGHLPVLGRRDGEGARLQGATLMMMMMIMTMMMMVVMMMMMIMMVMMTSS